MMQGGHGYIAADERRRRISTVLALRVGKSGRSLDRLDEAAMDGAVADDVEAHRSEGRQVGMGQHERHVVECQHFPLMQADEDVALLQTRLRRWRLGADVLDR